MLREGSCATFIGINHHGAESGDRCIVLADEGRYANVRWVSGTKTGSYDQVSAVDLVSDRKTKVSAFEDDEFGFEPDAPKAVRVASGMVYSSGGDAALMKALEHDGVLAGPRHLARQAIAELRETLRGDRAWREVVSELGADGEGFLKHALVELFTSALKEDGLHEAPDED